MIDDTPDRFVDAAFALGPELRHVSAETRSYSAYSPDLPGVVAAGATRRETQQLMLEAMAEHIAILRQAGKPVPEPADADSVTILDPAAA